MLKYNGRDNPRGVNQRRRRHRPELVARVGRRRRQEASVVASLRSRNRWHASETPMRHRKRRRSATAVADCGHFLFLMFYFILFFFFFVLVPVPVRWILPPPPPTHPLLDLGILLTMLQMATDPLPVLDLRSTSDLSSSGRMQRRPSGWTFNLRSDFDWSVHLLFCLLVLIKR